MSTFCFINITCPVTFHSICKWVHDQAFRGLNYEGKGPITAKKIVATNFHKTAHQSVWGGNILNYFLLSSFFFLLLLLSSIHFDGPFCGKFFYLPITDKADINTLNYFVDVINRSVTKSTGEHSHRAPQRSPFRISPC